MRAKKGLRGPLEVYFWLGWPEQCGFYSLSSLGTENFLAMLLPLVSSKDFCLHAEFCIIIQTNVLLEIHLGVGHLALRSTLQDLVSLQKKSKVKKAVT